MPIDIGGGNYITKIPALSEDADIQEALKLYHFGDGLEPQKSMVAHLARIEAEAIGTRVLDINTLPGVGNNLNNITQSGFYVQSSPSLASSGQNYPPFRSTPTSPTLQFPGLLKVTNGSPSQVGSDIVYQEYHAASTQEAISYKFVRRRFPIGATPAWSEWKRLIEDDHNHDSLYFLKGEVFNPGNPNDSTALGYTKAQTDARFLTLQNLPQTTPTGAIMLWPTDDNNVPEGWVACNGLSYPRYANEETKEPNEYTALYDIINGTYGMDGPTKFRVPNLRGRVPVGVNNDDSINPITNQRDFATFGQTGGSKTTTLTVAQMPSHNHTQNPHNHTQNAHNHNASTSSAGNHNHSGNTGGGNHNHSGSTSNVGNHQHSVNFVSSVGDNAVNRAGSSGTVRSVRFVNSSTANRATSGSGAHGHNFSVGGGSHNHSISLSGGGHNHNISVGNTTATNNNTTATNNNTGGGQPHNNLQPYIVLNYIIKL